MPGIGRIDSLASFCDMILIAVRSIGSFQFTVSPEP